MKPQRIQRKRSKGWKMPANTVYVGRGSRWGNPFKVGEHGTAAECVKKYADEALPYTHRPPHNTLHDFYISAAFIEDVQHELRGKNLACWCAIDAPCHAEVLLQIANEKSYEEFCADQAGK